jgi:hypothetical protein
VPHGIPYSVFMGRVVGPGQPQWTDQDRRWALAYEQAMRDLCPSCGGRRSVLEENPDAYVGQLSRCDGCQTLHTEQQNIPEQAAHFMRAYIAPARFARDDDVDEVPPRDESE